MSSESNPLIEKKTLYAGTKPITFKDGTRIHFHFQAKLCDKDETILDDSRKLGNGTPLNLVLGKKFKLEVWEVMLQKMALHEVAQFVVNKNLVMQYPFVSKTLRDMQKPKTERQTHCCAMTLQSEGVGYNDLNDFLKNPCDIEFTMEIVSVEQPEDYEKETWQLEDNERIAMIPQLKQQGNDEFKQKNYVKAADLYSKAIGFLDQLMLKEKPHDVEWNDYNKQKMPLLLNFAQCKLLEGDYYAVIEHCSTVIQSEKDSVKAYFRRGKAHVGAWNPDAAKADFSKVLELDPSAVQLVKKELAILDELLKQKETEDKQKLKSLFV